MDRDEARRVGRKLLGDRVTAFAEKSGIAAAVKVVEKLTGWRCGCERRTAAINRWDAGRRSQRT